MTSPTADHRPIPHNPTRHDPTPILTAIGDLNSPVWGDERDRLVHLEGADIAYQVQTFIGMAVAAALPWVLGPRGVPWSFAAFGAATVGSLCRLRYVTARGVPMQSGTRRDTGPHSVIFLGLLVVWAIGNLWALSGGLDRTVAVGAVAAVAAVAGVSAVVKRRLRAADAEVADDTFDR